MQFKRHSSRIQTEPESARTCFVADPEAATDEKQGTYDQDENEPPGTGPSYSRTQSEVEPPNVFKL